MQKENNWAALDKMMIDAAFQLKNAGADMVLVCANTMHLCSEAIQKNVKLPLEWFWRALTFLNFKIKFKK